MLPPPVFGSTEFGRRRRDDAADGRQRRADARRPRCGSASTSMPARRAASLVAADGVDVPAVAGAGQHEGPDDQQHGDERHDARDAGQLDRARCGAVLVEHGGHADAAISRQHADPGHDHRQRVGGSGRGPRRSRSRSAATAAYPPTATSASTQPSGHRQVAVGDRDDAPRRGPGCCRPRRSASARRPGRRGTAPGSPRRTGCRPSRPGRREQADRRRRMTIAREHGRRTRAAAGSISTLASTRRADAAGEAGGEVDLAEQQDEDQAHGEHDDRRALGEQVGEVAARSRNGRPHGGEDGCRAR